MWDQFFPVKLPQIVCTNSRNTIKSVEINGKTNCAAQSWHHWVFRKMSPFWMKYYYKFFNVFFFVKYAANVFQWQTFRSRESNHDLSWRLTPNSMPNSKFFQEPRTDDKFMRTIFYRVQNFNFFFLWTTSACAFIQLFFSFFPLWL